MITTILVALMFVITVVMAIIACDAHRRYVDEHKRAEILESRVRYHAREAVEERNRTTLFLEERRVLRTEVARAQGRASISERELMTARLDGREQFARELARTRYLEEDLKEFLIIEADRCQIEKFAAKLNIVVREHA